MKDHWLWKPNDSEVIHYRISEKLSTLKRHVSAVYGRDCTFTGAGPYLVWVHNKDGNEIGLITLTDTI